MHHGGQSARRVSKVAELTDLCEMAIRRAFVRSRCQRGTAVFAVVCPFCGTQEKCGARQNLDDARRWMARGLPSSGLAKFQRMFPVPTMHRSRRHDKITNRKTLKVELHRELYDPGTISR